MTKTKVAINGFGRIGRAFLKLALLRPELEVVAINDLGDIKSLAYLLKYDTAYGKSSFDVEVSKDEKSLIIKSEGKNKENKEEIKIAFVSEKDGAKLPWSDLKIDVVVESTGLFTSYSKAKFHLDAGAKRVVISAPAKDEEGSMVKGETVLMAMNEEKMKSVLITSNASCTTNAASPLLAILDETIGVEKALLNTVHGYTASQSLVDSPNKKDLREGRAAAQNIVPSSTGAAIAVTKVMKHLDGLFDGVAMRVPVVTGSIVDVTLISKKDTTKEEVNKILEKAAKSARWKGTFNVTNEPLVSSDIIGESHASLADLAFTRVVGGNLVKVLAWYDNEMGYTHTLIEHVIKVGALIKK